MSIVRLFTTVLLLAMLSAPLAAQSSRYRHGFRTLYPGSATLGLQAGANFNAAADGPRSSVDGSSFGEGSGFGFHAGIMLDFYINRLAAFRISAAYRDASSEYARTEQLRAYRQDGSAVTVDTDHRIATDPTYVDVALEIVWYTGPQGLYLVIGPDVALLLDGTLRETQSIKDDGYIFNSGSSRIVLRDGKIADLESPRTRIGARAGIGYDFPLSRSTVMAPELSISYPFTTVTKESDDWRLVIAQLSLQFRFGL